MVIVGRSLGRYTRRIGIGNKIADTHFEDIFSLSRKPFCRHVMLCDVTAGIINEREDQLLFLRFLLCTK